jgi:hypothetical protein
MTTVVNELVDILQLHMVMPPASAGGITILVCSGAVSVSIKKTDGFPCESRKLFGVLAFLLFGSVGLVLLL